MILIIYGFDLTNLLCECVWFKGVIISYLPGSNTILLQIILFEVEYNKKPHMELALLEIRRIEHKCLYHKSSVGIISTSLSKTPEMLTAAVPESLKTTSLLEKLCVSKEWLITCTIL